MKEHREEKHTTQSADVFQKKIKHFSYPTHVIISYIIMIFVLHVYIVQSQHKTSGDESWNGIIDFSRLVCW